MARSLYAQGRQVRPTGGQGKDFSAAAGKEVVEVFKRRRAKHYQPEMAAAAILDPAFFDVTDGDISLPLHLLTNSQREDVVAVVVRLKGGGCGG